MRLLYILLLILPLKGFGQTFYLSQKTQDVNASFRGLSIVSDSVAWVSGNDGHIGKTTNGGATWKWIKPKGFENLDFRDIEAFDEHRAVVINAGSPAYVLVTTDGGQSWKQTYKNTDSAMFLDGMDFWNDKRGLIFGDPIKNKMQLLETVDGGFHWQDISNSLTFELAVGEAGFAASGSSIKALDSGKVWIATGGKAAHVYFSENFGKVWEVYKCPILQGKPSTGAFSIDFIDVKTGMVGGGDYLKNKENANNILLTKDSGKTWTKPLKPVSGYRSSILMLSNRIAFATGTSGTDVSTDGGLNWYNISEVSFNTIKKAKKGGLILLVGDHGNIYTLKIN